MLRRLVRILLVVALGTALATAALTPTAVAQEPPTLTATLTGATLVAKGAAVDVAVTYSCASDTTSATIGVELTQRVGGNRLATGTGSTSGLVCDGAEHTTTVRVVAEGGIAFKKGDAVAEGTTVACNPFGCLFLPFPATVRIR
jgi:hypothetical protein